MSDLLTLSETMQVLGLGEKSRRSIYNYIQKGRLTPVKKTIGRGRGGTRVFFDRAEVEALKESAERPGAEQPAPTPGTTSVPKPKRTGKRGGK